MSTEEKRLVRSMPFDESMVAIDIASGTHWHDMFPSDDLLVFEDMTEHAQSTFRARSEHVTEHVTVHVRFYWHKADFV